MQWQRLHAAPSVYSRSHAESPDRACRDGRMSSTQLERRVERPLQCTFSASSVIRTDWRHTTCERVSASRGSPVCSEAARAMIDDTAADSSTEPSRVTLPASPPPVLSMPPPLLVAPDACKRDPSLAVAPGGSSESTDRVERDSGGPPPLPPAWPTVQSRRAPIGEPVPDSLIRYRSLSSGERVAGADRVARADTEPCWMACHICTRLSSSRHTA